MSKTKIINMRDSKIRIIGDNILYCNGVITAYYILPLNNYTITSNSGVLYSIQSITSLLSGLASQRQEVKFSLQPLTKKEYGLENKILKLNKENKKLNKKLKQYQSRKIVRIADKFKGLL